MTGAAERMRRAAWHERWVLYQLHARGTQAWPFGQALLPDDARAALRRCQTLAGAKAPVRWMPDLLVIRDTTVSFIDAKAGDKWAGTQNHDIEADALQAARNWEQALTADVWFVFSDGRAASVHTVMTHPDTRKGRWNGSGSGTPFWVFPRAICTELINPTPPYQDGFSPLESYDLTVARWVP